MLGDGTTVKPAVMRFTISLVVDLRLLAGVAFIHVKSVHSDANYQKTFRGGTTHLLW